MSIVEKAVERLRSLRPDPAATANVRDVARTQVQATIEREGARVQAEGAAPAAPQAPELWPVNMAELRYRGLLPPDGNESARLHDELRRVKRPLLDNVTGKSAHAPRRPERIMVASALPDEGKTFTTVNLALSLAREPDFEVLLVDGDVPKSDITRAFGLEGRRGLVDVLADERCAAADVVVRTTVPNLLVVPSGQRHTLTAELFGSRRMQDVLEQLGAQNRRRLLVFDSAPLLVTPDAPALAAHMGQVVMVVAAGVTQRQLVGAALQTLDAGQYVGLVLNKSRLPASESHYGYGYAYGYGRAKDASAPASDEADT